MSGIENSIQNKKEFKESYEGLRNEPRLITIDGPDGIGKTEISQKVIEKLKEKSKNPDDVIYLKYTRLMDTESQQNISTSIEKYVNKDGTWDKNKMDNILSLWAAKINRSYKDHVVPLIKNGKIVILDRSEVDLFRAGIEWGNEESLAKIIKYMGNGTLTNGMNAGNRIFITGLPEDTYKNLIGKKHLSRNDPRSLEEMVDRFKKQETAEELISRMNKKETPNIIKIQNIHVEETEKEKQLEKIANEIVSKLKF